jgi:hypothetical protein
MTTDERRTYEFPAAFRPPSFVKRSHTTWFYRKTKYNRGVNT